VREGRGKRVKWRLPQTNGRPQPVTVRFPFPMCSRRRRRTTAVALLAAAALAFAPAAGPSPAEARGLVTGFAEDNMFLSPDASTRATWFNRAVTARAQIARVNLYWRKVVGSTPPANPTNPADPDYDFSRLDGAVRDAHARHLRLMITVFGAPRWAEGRNPPPQAPAGSWKPDPHALGQFAQALAKRYSGSFRGLPRVRLFEAWNEPNLSVNLTPQWVGRKPESPGRYRRMLNAFDRGVKRVQPGAIVVGGATAPFGDPRTHPRDPRLPRMRPLAFLRKVFCLNRRLKPGGCHAKTHLDVLSHHPINTTNRPTYRAINHDDIEVADFHKLRPLIHAAEKTGHVRPRGHHPLWATELGWYTKPPSIFGVPPRKQARWLEQGLYLLWRQGASVAINFLLRDAPHTNVYAGSSGVFFPNGQRKPSYKSFRFPFVTHRKSKRKVGAWGKSPTSGTVKIQRRGKHGWGTLKRMHVRRGRVFTTSLRLRRAADLRAKVGTDTSLSWHQR
jgi:hypothetical protein